jgi:hypothetical protein
MPTPSQENPTPIPGMSTTESGVFPRDPSAAQRIGRGLMWGALYGQCWTLCAGLGEIFFGYTAMTGQISWGDAIWRTLIFTIFFGIVGSILGLIIGAVEEKSTSIGVGIVLGTVVGVVGGLLSCGLELLITWSPSSLFTLVLWFFSGRYMGTNIGRKVNEPVVPR